MDFVLFTFYGLMFYSIHTDNMIYHALLLKPFKKLDIYKSHNFPKIFLKIVLGGAGSVLLIFFAWFSKTCIYLTCCVFKLYKFCLAPLNAGYFYVLIKFYIFIPVT